MSDLKPCPFCGSGAIVPAMPIGITDDDTPVECTNMDCNASDVTFDKKDWYTRPIEDALRKEIAQLQADNRSLVEQMNQMVLMMEHKSETVQRSQGSSTIKAIYGLEAVKYKDNVLSWVETMFEKEKKAKDALMKSDVMLVDKSGFLALCNLLIEKLQGETHE